MKKIRVLVADDSLTIRKRIVEALNSDSGIEVVGESTNGKEAIELCEKLKPDVITLDMVMPVMTGLAATIHIMAYCPTPILIVSASVNRGELFQTYDALKAGAVDVVDKSSPTASDPRFWDSLLIAKVKLVARIKVITHLQARVNPNAFAHPALKSGAEAMVKPTHNFLKPRLVAIGASTGGPAAIQKILQDLPGDFPLPILMVVHISKPFGLMFSEWLDKQSKIRVVIPQNGQPLPKVGQPIILLAPADQHLVVRNECVYLTDDAEIHSCRPAIDTLFQSIAKELGNQTIACLLSGMGKDGANGLLAIRNSGGVTFAQDEASSVVFGMPKEAIAIGGASEVLSLEEFAPKLISYAALAVSGLKRRST